jgi:hypothetical protein
MSKLVGPVLTLLSVKQNSVKNNLLYEHLYLQLMLREETPVSIESAVCKVCELAQFIKGHPEDCRIRELRQPSANSTAE